jgi:hypothetical protein
VKLRGAALLLAVLCVGCATVVPPPPSDDSVAVYLTNYGRHSSVLIPGNDGWLHEYAYGDWEWFAENRVSKMGAVRALLWSRGATLGRRLLKPKADDVETLTKATKAYTVNRFYVPRDKADKLIAQLDRDFFSQLNTITYSSYCDLWFVRSNGYYSGLYNCNHFTAKWLKTLGCQIRGPVMFSAFKVRASR